MRHQSRQLAGAFARLFLWVFAIMMISGSTLAAVRFEGQWPDADTDVSLDADALTRAEAVHKLAEQAGWSLVLRSPPSDQVTIHVRQQPARKVLEMLLVDGDYVAKREGSLVSIGPLAVAQPAVAAEAPPSPPVPPEPAAAQPSDASDEPPDHSHADDRVVFGGSVRVEKGEVVHDVAVFGGSADIFGTAKGDVTVMGGSARVHSGAHVMGDATAVGGSLTVDDGARVDGDVGVVGGLLKRGTEAIVGGDERGDSDVHLRRSHGAASPDHGWTIRGLLGEAGRAVTRVALLFVFGAIFLALAASRMQALQVEVASRPMRSMALGVVGGLGSIALAVALCVTFIGIPVAFFGVLLGVIFAYVGICAVLTTVGAALLRHRTSNPYVHLAVGCGLFLIASSIPYLGGFVTAAVVLIGFGAVVATRGMGFIPPGKPTNQGPYRTAAV